MAYAPVSYTATAAQTDFVVTFDFLRPGHLVVRIDNVLKTLTTHYTLESGETIVRLVTPATGGETVAISRSTPVDERLVDFAAGAGISETDLDESFLQLFFNLEELLYLTEADNIAASVAAAAASAAAAAASEAAALASENAASDSEIAAAASETAAAASAVAALGWSGLGGMGLTRTSATVITVAKGACRDSTNTYSMYLSAAETIDLTVSGAGGLGVSRPSGAADWIHAFVIRKDSDASIDVYGDTSVSAANIPAGYTAYRRIGSFLVDASAPGDTVNFFQRGDEFYWTTPTKDVDNATPGTSAVLNTMNVPDGVKVKVLLNAYMVTDSSDDSIYLSSPDADDLTAPSDGTTAPGMTLGGRNSTGGAGIDIGVGPIGVWSNTSAQIRSRNSRDAQISLFTVGWVDLRGKDV